jgi:hypothetical protein
LSLDRILPEQIALLYALRNNPSAPVYMD